MVINIGADIRNNESFVTIHFLSYHFVYKIRCKCLHELISRVGIVRFIFKKCCSRHIIWLWLHQTFNCLQNHSFISFVNRKTSDNDFCKHHRHYIVLYISSENNRQIICKIFINNFGKSNITFLRK